MKNKTCCFTGHRNLKKYDESKIKIVLEEKIEEQINNGVINFECGGALGFDTLAALSVLKMKEKYPQIKLILILPCENQAEGWKDNDIEVYKNIKSKADEVFYVSKEYHKKCMIERNKYMVDNADCVIAMRSTYKRSGTYATTRYAEKGNKTIVYLEKSDFNNSEVNYDFEYSFDFTKNIRTVGVKKDIFQNFDKVLNEASFDGTADDLIDRKKKEEFFRARNNFFCIARESYARMRVKRNKLEPCIKIELESAKLNFNTESLRNYFVDILRSVELLYIENRARGNFAIIAKFELMRE